MTSVLPGADTRDAAHSPPGDAPERLRSPRGWLAVRPGVPLLAGALGALYLAISYFRPLWHTDLWGHLAYGRYLAGRGFFPLPATEPLMPLAAGVRFVDTAWLAQWIGFQTHEAAGLAGLVFLYAGGTTLCAILLAWRFFRRTENVAVTLFGVGLFLWLNWQQVIRPQLGGLVLFVFLLVLLTGRWSRLNWLLVPALFAVWVNLHASFPAGLALIAAFCIGRAADIERRTHNFRLIFADAAVRRYFVLLELAALATLLNPYGLGIYAEVISVATHPNLTELTEWQPLTLRMPEGRAAAFAAAALIFAYRLTPRRVRAVEPILLLGCGLAALWTSRMLVWWAPVAAWLLVLHGNAIWKRERPARTHPARPRTVWTFLAIALAVAALAVSPLGLYLLRGTQPEARSVLSRATPIGATEYLAQNPPSGLIFNPYEWGDYLLWAGPPDLQVFVASHAHLVPGLVWQHYLQIIELRSEWSELLDHYGVNTVVLDKPRRRPLIIRLQRSEAWQTAYEDERAVIFTRREPIR
jgi:hypothetical protein